MSHKHNSAALELFHAPSAGCVSLRDTHTTQQTNEESPNNRQAEKLSPKSWKVQLTDPVFGVRQKLGSVKARCLVEAQILADLEFKAALKRGQKLLVSPGRAPRRPDTSDGKIP